MKQLQKITAYNWKKGQRVDLEYHSIAEARKHNPTLVDFREVE